MTLNRSNSTILQEETIPEDSGDCILFFQEIENQILQNP